jgi:hypothetical protein
VILNNTTVTAGALLSLTGSGNHTLDGSLGVGLPGSADVLGAVTHDVVDYSGVTGTFTDSSTFSDSNGLWTVSDSGTVISVTLNNQVGTVGNGGTVILGSPEDAGYVELTGLISGKKSTLTLDLVNFDSDINAVAAELGNNDLFFNVLALDSDRISFDFLPGFAGTGYFAWDNVNSLGADVAGVGFSIIPEPASLVLLALAGLMLMRRRW